MATKENFRRQNKTFAFQTLNGRLPLEHGSDRRETLGKHISFFDVQQIVLTISFFKNVGVDVFVQESCVVEALGIFERHWQIPCRKSLPVVRLFFLYDPWRRGKSGTDHFCT